MSVTPRPLRLVWLRQLTLVAGTTLLLNACGGGAGTESATAKVDTSAITPASESTARLAEGAVLNAQELERARLDAESTSTVAQIRPGGGASLTAYKSGEVAQKASAGLLPVYRFFNTQTGTHFYTSSTSERDSIIANLPAFSLDGQAFFAAAKASVGLNPVYRFFNSLTGVHFFTISENERAAIEAGLPQFKLEGVAYYASQVAGAGFTPLYRFFQPGAGTHFYTASESERQHIQDALSNPYRFEGVGYYVFDNSYKPALPLVFSASDGTLGHELWTTDGTTAGTVMIKDIFPGFPSSIPSNFTQLNDVWIFSANDSMHGDELWITKGTVAGTAMIKDINPGSASSQPMRFTWFKKQLYFRATDGMQGAAMWRTDGTDAGTVKVDGVKLGYEGNEMVVFDGALYYQGRDDSHGNELWKSDGTPAGTVLVKDINPGIGGSSAYNFKVFNGALYFAAHNGENGKELWKTDGTTAGTVMVKDINQGAGGSFPYELTVFKDALYFTAHEAPTATKAASSGSDRVGAKLVDAATVEPDPFQPPVAMPGGPGESGEVTLSVDYVELWKTDGTEAGTERVKDIKPGPSGSAPIDLTVFNGALYFMADDGRAGYEVWQSDGTDAGTVMLKDINPGSGGSYRTPMWYHGGEPPGFTAVNGSLCFMANDGQTGYELWKTDGTSAGTVMVKDIHPGLESSSPSRFKPLNGALLFSANDGSNGVELWRTDGTPQGTAMVKDINPISAPIGSSYPTLDW